MLRPSGIYLSQQSLHLQLLVVVANVWEVKWVVRKELLGGTKKLKKLFMQKNVFRAWLTNKSFEQLRLYFTGHKAAATIVKQSKEKSWKEFGLKFDMDYKLANKVFWKTIHCL